MACVGGASLLHLAELRDSGRWRRYYRWEEIVEAVREAADARDTWARLAGLPEGETPKSDGRRDYRRCSGALGPGGVFPQGRLTLGVWLMFDQDDAQKKIHRPALKRTDFYPIHCPAASAPASRVNGSPSNGFWLAPFHFCRHLDRARCPQNASLHLHGSSWRNPESSFIDFV